MELVKRKKHVRTRDLAFVIGDIQCTKAQYQRGALHNKQLQKLKDKEVSRRGWNKLTQLNKIAIPNIIWWIIQLANNQLQCFTKSNKCVTIQADFSKSGWGARLIRENQEKVFAHGEWKDNNLRSSNLREETAVLKDLLEFRQQLIQQQLIGI
ncbi:MAG: hypothetical protein EZS28_035418 [Streblomastix strix]|uniref:Uncharacterized protein n=1 Tax=Streblomastix strix TaxID=222440 RepID=A0A5J4UFU4_9EUKA|nr:MAG: hypothetical protein EZS28_035418 [Streblomastix strix]